MERYLLFGFVPIRVSAEGTWTTDVSKRPAGEGFKNWAANYLVNQVLGFITILEWAFKVEIPVRVDSVKHPKGPNNSAKTARTLCQSTTCDNRANCKLV